MSFSFFHRGAYSHLLCVFAVARNRRSSDSRCGVTNCSRNTRNSPGAVFHDFPTDSGRRRLRMDAAHRSDPQKRLSPKDHIGISSHHFLPVYTRDLHPLAGTGFSTKHGRIKQNTVPSIFAARTPSKTVDCSSLKRHRARVCIFSPETACILRSPCRRKHIAPFRHGAS